MLYFYLVHLFQPAQFCLRLPVYLEASSADDAKRQADILLNLFKPYFEILWEPSPPLLLIDATAQSCEAMIDEATKLPNVKFHLPNLSPLRCYQKLKPPQHGPLIVLEAGVLAPGRQQTSYFL